MFSLLKYILIYTRQFESRPDLAWRQYQTYYSLKQEAARLAGERLAIYCLSKQSCWDSPRFHREDMEANRDETYLIMRAVYAVDSGIHDAPKFHADRIQRPCALLMN